MNYETQPELKDIMKMIDRYVEANGRNVYFVGGFISYNGKGFCEGCGCESDEMFDEKGSQYIAYGDLSELRDLLNNLRDSVEDNVNEDGFVML